MAARQQPERLDTCGVFPLQSIQAGHVFRMCAAPGQYGAKRKRSQLLRATGLGVAFYRGCFDILLNATVSRAEL